MPSSISTLALAMTRILRSCSTRLVLKASSPWYCEAVERSPLEYTLKSVVKGGTVARCEVCGVDQYPANTKTRYGKDQLRHFFCSNLHAEQWIVEQRDQITIDDLLLAPETSPSSEEESVVVKVESTFPCDLCGFEAKTEAGLSAHKRLKHKKL